MSDGAEERWAVEELEALIDQLDQWWLGLGRALSKGDLDGNAVAARLGMSRSGMYRRIKTVRAEYGDNEDGRTRRYQH